MGDAGSSPACLATGSSVTGSTPALRSDVFSIPRRRDASFENLETAANAGRTTSPSSARSRVRVPPGPSMRARSSVGRAGRLSKTSSPQLEYSAGMPARTTFALVRKGLGYFLVPPPNKAGECRWEYIGGGFGLRFESAKFSSSLVAGTDQTGECRSDYMGERLLRQEVGGSIPPLGNRVAQQECPAITCRPPFRQRRMPSGLHGNSTVAGSSPAGPLGP